MSIFDEGALLVVLAYSPFSRWMVEHNGPGCPEFGPCLIPVALGVVTPAGAVVIGVALVRCDVVQRLLGSAPALLTDCAGAILPFLLALRELMLAFDAAFVPSNLKNFVVFTALQRRSLLIGVLLSAVDGMVLDSIAFLVFASGSLDCLTEEFDDITWLLVVALQLICLVRQVSVASV